MEQRGITQPQLAAGAGISQASISRYLNAQTEPKIGDFRALADFLNVPFPVLLGEEVQSNLIMVHGNHDTMALGERYEGSEEEKKSRLREIEGLLDQIRHTRNRLVHQITDAKAELDTLTAQLARLDQLTGHLSSATDLVNQVAEQVVERKKNASGPPPQPPRKSSPPKP